mgnify:CR=1 FL=1
MIAHDRDGIERHQKGGEHAVFEYSATEYSPSGRFADDLRDHTGHDVRLELDPAPDGLHILTIAGADFYFYADGDVDLLDHAAFVLRMNGPFADPTVAEWHLFDLDPDYDMDNSELALWQNAFPGE